MKKTAQLALVLTLALSVGTQAQSPDVIVGSLPDIASWGSSGGISSYSIGTTSCNVGNAPLDWYANTNQHPAIRQNIYRLESGRFEQLGLSWVKHGFFALSGSLCSPCQTGTGGGTTLGIGCSDPYGSGLNGSPSYLGPNSGINATTGFFTMPQPGPGSGTLNGRIQIPTSDMDPAQHPNALYFGEGHYIHPDDALIMDDNNASWRQLTVSSPTSVGLTGPTVQQQPAIFAWQVHDTGVVINTIDVDGRFYLGGKVSDLGGGTYHYELVLYNMNSDRCAAGLSVAAPAGATLSNLGFKDVHHHTGEPYNGIDWNMVIASNGASWTCTETFATNPNANALRWGTLYNFSFDSNLLFDPQVTIDMFKSGGPMTASSTLTLPAPPTPSYQLNNAASHLTIAGVNNADSLSNPNQVQLLTNTNINVEFGATAVGAPYEWALTAGPAVPDTIGLVGGQRLNINLLDPTLTLLNGGFGSTIPATSFTLPINTGTSSFNATLQQAVIDATAPAGIALSAASEVTIAGCVPVTLNHALGDDDEANVALGGVGGHNCLTSISFAGSNYSDLWINSNGSVTFGSHDGGDWTPSPSDFVGQQPRLTGMWSDISPNAGGTVSSSSNSAGDLTISFVNTQQYSSSNVVSFDIVFYANGACAIENFTLGSWSSSSLVGLNPGSGAISQTVNWASLVGSTVNYTSNRAVYQYQSGSGVGGFSSITFLNGDASTVIVN